MKLSLSITTLLVVLLSAVSCTDTGKPVTTESGLVYTVVEEGSGPAASAGQYVLIHETTTHTDGTVLYSTLTDGQPLRFLLGSKEVIEGVDEGVTGMRAGERRKMIVPPSLSRRTAYPNGLSPEDTLHYDIQLVEIEQR